ncbi:unnamed protein product [Cylicocyclus nassatus]|nr:unnamed protein product [Cylicocyclus nassatus]
MTIKQLEVKYSVSPKATSYYVIVSSGCSTGGVEIKAQKDQLMSGYRFCAEENVGKTITSSNEIVPVIIYNRKGATELELEYRTGT